MDDIYMLADTIILGKIGDKLITTNKKGIALAICHCPICSANTARLWLQAI